LTADKVKQINLLDSLPYEEPEEEAPEDVEVTTEPAALEDIQTELDEDGQITLSLE
jgi:topoisomerase-4 subunit A